MAIPEFKIRASQASKILGVKGLGETGKNYVKDWLKSYLYGYSRTFSSKYTAKGNACEEQGIDLVSRVHGKFLIKNAERRSNAFAEGECDIETKDTIEDIKNSWDAYTFPLFEPEPPTPAYIPQGQVYLWLWDKGTFKLHYCLNDAPPDIIDFEYWKKHKELKLPDGEVNEQLFDEVRSKMIHSHLPDHLRLKTYTIQRDEKLIKTLENRVLECRELILSLK